MATADAPEIPPPTAAAGMLEIAADNVQIQDNFIDPDRTPWIHDDTDSDDEDDMEKRFYITRKICGYVFLCMPQDVALLVISCMAFLCCLIDTVITTTGFNITNGACPMSSRYSEIGYMEYGSVQLLCEGSTYANMVCQLVLVVCFLVNWIVELRDKQCWLLLQSVLLSLGLATMLVFLILHVIGLVWWCEGVGRALKPEDNTQDTWYFVAHCFRNLEMFDGIAENYHLAPLFKVEIAEMVFSSLSCVLWTILLFISFFKWHRIRQHLKHQKNYDAD